MSRTKEIKLAPLNEGDLNIITDGQFVDSYGNVVKHGDRIIIEHNYNYQHHNNREALVEWNPSRGMYNYVFIDDTRFKSIEDFYGIHSFKLIVRHENLSESISIENNSINNKKTDIDHYTVMLSLFSQFGWIVKTGDEQKNGSSADIYAEHNDEDGKYTMRIDDGNCHNELRDAVYHIYATGGKVFEGRIGIPEDFMVVMRVLGFNKTKLE